MTGRFEPPFTGPGYAPGLVQQLNERLYYNQPLGASQPGVDEDVLLTANTADQDVASEEESQFDTMVASASIPNLASLFKRGIKTGVIQPKQQYA